MLDSVGRNISTVSMLGMSNPSLNMSTANTMSSSPVERASRDLALGSESGPEWTDATRIPALLKCSAMKSACCCEQQKPNVRLAPTRCNCSSAFWALARVDTAVVNAASSNRLLLQGMLL